MTESEKLQTLIQYRLEQAREALSAAELNSANNLYRSAVNRAYYAMFYCALALARIARRRNVAAQRRHLTIRSAVRQARSGAERALALAP